MKADKLFDISQKNHRIFRALLQGTPREQLLRIPSGFRNNILWNIAHALVTQQLLIYDRSAYPMLVPADLVAKFRKGTVPDGTATDKEIETVGELLETVALKTHKDYNAGIFKEYEAFTTSNKVRLQHIEDALTFNAFHEGLHLGVILSLQKAGS